MFIDIAALPWAKMRCPFMAKNIAYRYFALAGRCHFLANALTTNAKMLLYSPWKIVTLRLCRWHRDSHKIREGRCPHCCDRFWFCFLAVSFLLRIRFVPKCRRCRRGLLPAAVPVPLHIRHTHMGLLRVGGMARMAVFPCLQRDIHAAGDRHNRCGHRAYIEVFG